MTDRLDSTTSGSQSNEPRPGCWPRWIVPLVVAGILAVQLPMLATTLDDIDPFNFALGVRDFDPRRHQPHPPGYPIYIALAKVSTAVIDAARPEPMRGVVAGQRNAAQGLAFWSAIFGALAVVPFFALFRRLFDLDAAERLGVEAPVASAPKAASGVAAWVRRGPIEPALARRLAAGAVLLAVASPLFWFTCLRPLSDVPGLVAASAVQVLILRAWAMPAHGAAGGAAARAWAMAGLVTALIVGIRLQTLWLTLPLLAVALLRPLRARAWRSVGSAIGGLIAGGLIWAVPLVIQSGGPRAYLAALGAQGGEDFTGVDMLFRQPTARRLAFGLLHTFVWPWASVPLAAAVIGLAAVGAIWLAWRRPAVIGWLAVAFGPYAVFHLVFHETVTTRYAMPILPPVAFLASAGAWTIARRVHPIAVAVIAAVSLAAAVPAGWAYSAAGSPIARAVVAMAERAAATNPRPVLAMHERPDRDSRRALEWMLGDRPFWSARLPRVVGEEVRRVITLWAGGEHRPIWFVASPRRTDLALVDPAARRVLGDFDWPFASNTFAGNTRPGRVIWYELASPGWFLDRGWALTPELAGADARDGKGPSLGAVEAWVRRRGDAATLMIGGRDLARPGTAPGRLDVAIDGRPLVSIATRTGHGSFLEFIALPPGTLGGDGDYARLSAVVVAEDGSGRATSVAIEQFDVQNQDRVTFGFGRGWNEPEYNPTTGRSWRWTSDRAALLVGSTGRDVTVRVSGESPLRYYDRAPVVSLVADGREFHRVEPRRDFSFEATVPHSALAASAGRIWLITDLWFVPDEREGNGDRRRLGLRIYDIGVTPR